MPDAAPGSQILDRLPRGTLHLLYEDNLRRRPEPSQAHHSLLIPGVGCAALISSHTAGTDTDLFGQFSLRKLHVFSQLTYFLAELHTLSSFVGHPEVHEFHIDNEVQLRYNSKREVQLHEECTRYEARCQ